MQTNRNIWEGKQDKQGRDWTEGGGGQAEVFNPV